VQEVLFAVRREIHPRCEPRELRAFHSEDGDVSPKRRPLQEPHGVTISKKTAFLLL
jgi:hypothetical protein